MSILGNRVTRSEDPRFITGTATFGDDVKAQGAMHATFVRSILPHARITGIDTSAVSEIPGARAFTAADIALDPLPIAMPGLEEQMPRPVIAREGGVGVGHHRQLLDVDDDALGRVRALEAVLGEHDGNDLTREPGDVTRDHRSRHLLLETGHRHRERVERDVRGGECTGARDLGHGARVDARDPGVREDRADERRVQRALRLDVVAEGRGARDEPRVLAARHPVAEDAHGRRTLLRADRRRTAAWGWRRRRRPTGRGGAPPRP